jgi:hypothetical protein
MAKSKKRTDRKFKTLNVNPGAGGVRIDLGRYEAVKKAILLAVPRNMAGIAFKDLSRAVAARVPRTLFRGASIRWYTTTVKLDLEARGVIERTPNVKPQHVRRISAARAAGRKARRKAVRKAAKARGKRG